MTLRTLLLSLGLASLPVSAKEGSTQHSSTLDCAIIEAVAEQIFIEKWGLHRDRDATFVMYRHDPYANYTMNCELALFNIVVADRPNPENERLPLVWIGEPEHQLFWGASVEIGFQFGPLYGQGDRCRVRRQHGEWRVISCRTVYVS